MKSRSAVFSRTARASPNWRARRRSSLAGFRAEFNAPGRQYTGFGNPEFSIAGKWADLLKQMAPAIARVAFVFNPGTSSQSKLYVSAAQAAAASLRVAVMAAPVNSTVEVEETLARSAREPNIGLIFPPISFTRLRAKLIVETTARHRSPAIYADAAFMAAGGLMRFSHDQSEPLPARSTLY